MMDMGVVIFEKYFQALCFPICDLHTPFGNHLTHIMVCLQGGPIPFAYYECPDLNMALPGDVNATVCVPCV